MTILSPVRHLEDLSRDYPRIWRDYGNMLAGRGVALPDWPAWCYCPLAAAFAIASRGSDPGYDVGRIGALAAWRPTQGIYRFGEELLDALWSTPITGDLPVEHLQRLPAWCVYVETPGRDMLGFFAHLEHDANTGQAELRLLLDHGDALTPVPLHLGGDLASAVDGMLAGAAVQAARVGSILHTPAGSPDAIRELVAPVVSTLLYLCATDAELRPTRGQRSPKRARKPKRARNGEWLAEAADKPEVYHTGFDLSRRLREAHDGDSGGGKRGHVRRAHWHSYWLGSGEAKRLELRWLHPILVGVGPDRATVVSVPGTDESRAGRRA